MLRFAMPLLKLALLLRVVACQLGWPTGSVHHAYYDTPKGQLHYVTSGLESGSAPLVYLHSHPRSSADFKYVFSELNGSMPLLAIDWFGMGFSDAYAGQDSKDEFCTYEEFADYVLEILDKEGVTEFVPVGTLKGAHPTVEVAAKAGQQRVKKAALLGLLILNPQQQAFIENVLVPTGKHPNIFANGSHLQNIWNDPSATNPLYPGDLLVNQEKTNDEMRSLFTNWQLQAAWAAYNEKLPKRLAEVDAFAQTLLVHPLIAYRIWTTYGLDPAFSLSKMGETLTHGHNTSHFVEATEGLLHQNASYIAGLLKEFAQQEVVEVPPKADVVEVSLLDPSREGRLVNATVCVPKSEGKVPLLIFAHGWLVAADDYAYLCQGLADTTAVALIKTPLEDPAVQPPLLTPLAADAALLSHALPKDPKLAARLTGQVVLGGHSMGGGTSVLAAAALGAKADALALWAPGLYGSPEANASVASKVKAPTLVMFGNEDCVNVADVPLRGIDAYQNMGSQHKVLVALKEVNHCFWTTPVVGSCAYDICTSVSRLEQQALGIKIFQSYARAALSGAWSDFENFLNQGKDGSVEWQHVVTHRGSSYVGNITYEMCPKKCCSDSLAKMGLCKQNMDVFV